MTPGDGNRLHDVVDRARNDDADRHLAIVGAIRRVQRPAAAVEAHLSGYRAFELALELGARAEGVDRLAVGARRKWSELQRRGAVNAAGNNGHVRKRLRTVRLPLCGPVRRGNRGWPSRRRPYAALQPAAAPSRRRTACRTASGR